MIRHKKSLDFIIHSLFCFLFLFFFEDLPSLLFAPAASSACFGGAGFSSTTGVFTSFGGSSTFLTSSTTTGFFSSTFSIIGSAVAAGAGAVAAAAGGVGWFPPLLFPFRPIGGGYNTQTHKKSLLCSVWMSLWTWKKYFITNWTTTMTLMKCFFLCSATHESPRKSPTEKGFSMWLWQQHCVAFKV